MTEKQKAIELVNKFHDVEDPDGYLIDYESAKECALICVDQIIEAYIDSNTEHEYDHFTPYWQDVKEEIKKLSRW